MEGREDQKPNLSRHRAFSEDVINGFHCLIAEEAFFSRIQAVPPSPVPSPVASFESEPKKDFHLERSPGPPDEVVSTELDAPGMESDVG